MQPLSHRPLARHAKKLGRLIDAASDSVGHRPSTGGESEEYRNADRTMPSSRRLTPCNRGANPYVSARTRTSMPQSPTSLYDEIGIALVFLFFVAVGCF